MLYFFASGDRLVVEAMLDVAQLLDRPKLLAKGIDVGE